MRIVAAAAELFAARGYAATTVQAIAQAAGVSAVSVQQNGPKSALLLAALQFVSSGAEGFDSLREVPEMAARADELTRPADLIRITAEFAAASNARVSRLWIAMDRAADEDPDVAETFGGLIRRMRADTTVAIGFLAGLGALRTDRDREQLADILWTLPLPDLYHRLVEQCGWTPERYTRWLEDSLTEQLLEPASPQ